MIGIHTFFITDGTKYHDGDVEEVVGVVLTTLPRSVIERHVHNTRKLRKTMSDSEAIETKFRELQKKFGGNKLAYIPFDWEHSTNVIGVSHD